MKSYARINENSEVIAVISATQEDVTAGVWGDPATLIETVSGDWKQRMSNGETLLRKYKATGGMIYDPVRDAFYWKKPETGNWVLNETTLLWQPA